MLNMLSENISPEIPKPPGSRRERPDSIQKPTADVSCLLFCQFWNAWKVSEAMDVSSLLAPWMAGLMVVRGSGTQADERLHGGRHLARAFCGKNRFERKDLGQKDYAP